MKATYLVEGWKSEKSHENMDEPDISRTYQEIDE